MSETRDDPIVQLHVLIAEVKRLREDVIEWRDTRSVQVRWAIVISVVMDLGLLALSLTALYLAVQPG